MFLAYIAMGRRLIFRRNMRCKREGRAILRGLLACSAIRKQDSACCAVIEIDYRRVSSGADLRESIGHLNSFAVGF